MEPIRVILIDDHAVVRDGLSAILSSQSDIEIVASAATARDGLERIKALQPNVVLMDLRLPQMDGLSAVLIVTQQFPKVRVLMLSSHDGDGAITRALAAGAGGYVLKSAPVAELLEAIRTVQSGKTYLSSGAADSLAVSKGLSDLTEREIEILECVADGMGNKSISTALQVAEKTVKNHLSSVFEKLGAEDRTHAVTIATARGIIEMPNSVRRIR
jgi:DNA-binding NarL/FixJ family response regulator